MDIEKILTEIKNQILELLSSKYKEFEPELKKEIDRFLAESKEKLERWALLLLNKSITKDELEWLLKSQQELVVLQTLQVVGISKIKINNLKNNILNIVLSTIIKAL